MFVAAGTEDALIAWAESGPIEEGRLSASYQAFEQRTLVQNLQVACGERIAMTEPLQMLRGGPRPSSSSKPDDDFASRALVFRAQRQALLASNIANADTPNYKAMDVSFQDSLHAATVAESATSAMQPGAGTLVMTASGHIPAVTHPTESTLAFARYIAPAQPRLDGNTVDLDRERGEFSKNAILYRLALMSLDDESKEFKQASSDPRTATR